MNILNEINTIKTQSELNKFKEEINEAFEKRSKFITLCDEANKASLKSFGFIKESFENISPLLFNNKEGKKILNRYITTIKNNKNLSKLHSLYESIRKTNKNNDIDFFINNITNIDFNINKNSIKEDTKILGRILAEGMLKIGNNSINMLSKDNDKVDNAIEFIAENKKNINNISEYSNAINIIKEHINNNPINNLYENKDIDKYINELLENFNKKYNEELNNEELYILKEVINSNNKEDLFNKYKQNCIETLKNAEKNFSNESLEKEKITQILEKINNKSFVLENVTKDICGFSEIIKLF